jgi:hypothetical protein
MINNYQITKKMLLNKNHLVLLTTTYLMFLIEFQLSQYIGLNILQQYDIEVQQINRDWLKGDILYNYILMYLSIRNTNIMLIYLNLFYVYIGILNIIIRDTDLLVDFHILYGLIVLSLKYEYILIEFSSKTILGICGCLYIRKVLYKLYKLYLN